jgi:hypothetical protein
MSAGLGGAVFIGGRDGGMEVIKRVFARLLTFTALLKRHVTIVL